jgi:hypothetical protein
MLFCEIIRQNFESFFLESSEGSDLLLFEGRTMGVWVGIGGCILDGELAPEVYCRLSQRNSKPMDMRLEACSS